MTTLPVGIELLRANNPSPMTLDGTNTYVVVTPMGNVVIDPGPDLPVHLNAVASHGAVVVALLTHRHSDHSAGAVAFHELTGAPVRAVDSALTLGGPVVGGGDELAFGDVVLHAVATPGHTSDSMCFAAEIGGTNVLFSGDTVLGCGTTIVAHPDGRLDDYLTSLHNLRDMTSGSPWQLLPGHGPVRDDAHAVISEYIAHRMERLDQVRAALASGAKTEWDVVEIVYADVDRSVRSAAAATVRAQLEFLYHQEQ